MKALNQFLCIGLSVCSSWAFAKDISTEYNVSTLLDMSTNSAFAQQNCPQVNGSYTCYVEGSTNDIFGNIYVTTVLPKGKIFKITPDGQASVYATFDIGSADPTAVDSNNVSFRIEMDPWSHLYVSYRSLDSQQNPTDMNGVWRVPEGGGHCSTDSSNTCTKIFPAIGATTTPAILFPDGMALDHFGHMYLADAQMGNIWKIDLFDKSGALWAGSDANSSPNYLAGSPMNFLLGSPVTNRGFGVVGLAYDAKNNMLYGATFDTASVVAIPVQRDGSAGTQALVLNMANEDKQLESISIVANHNSGNNRKLVVGHTMSSFQAFTRYLGCAYGIPGFCPANFVPPSNGQELLAADLDAGTGLSFGVLLNNPELKLPASVINGVRNDTKTLYINALGQIDSSGSKILKATPVNP